jgi:hypothetical protein
VAAATAHAPEAGDPGPEWHRVDDRPLPGDAPPLETGTGDGGHELSLEGVTYHGGFPGHDKRRKKCTLLLNGDGLSVSGASGPEMSVAWSAVSHVEAQNSDEAKFRLNIKAKRNSSVLVVDCEDGSTIVLEAPDVATLALRSALTDIVAGHSVDVA